MKKVILLGAASKENNNRGCQALTIGALNLICKNHHLEGQSNNNTLSKKLISKTSEFYYFKKHYTNQVWLIKSLYAILYFIDWIILNNKDSKKLLKEVMIL